MMSSSARFAGFHAALIDELYNTPSPTNRPQEWWERLPVWGDRGRIDCVLQLVNRGIISNSKARELMRCIWDGEDGLPWAPWKELDFDED